MRGKILLYLLLFMFGDVEAEEVDEVGLADRHLAAVELEVVDNLEVEIELDAFGDGVGS